MAYGDQEGGFTTSLDGEDAETAGKIAIRLDRERLAEMKHARPQWYTSLPFLVSADEAVFKLQWRLKGVRSVDDQELARKNAELSLIHICPGRRSFVRCGCRRTPIPEYRHCGRRRQVLLSMEHRRTS